MNFLPIFIETITCTYNHLHKNSLASFKKKVTKNLICHFKHFVYLLCKSFQFTVFYHKLVIKPIKVALRPTLITQRSVLLIRNQWGIGHLINAQIICIGDVIMVIFCISQGSRVSRLSHYSSLVAFMRSQSRWLLEERITEYLNTEILPIKTHY